MLRRTLFLAVAALMTALATSSKAEAWGAYHAGYTHAGYGGVQHYGYTGVHAGGYGSYGGYHYGGYGAYGGYHYGGYHYGNYGGYPANVGAYRYGYVRRW